jgi:hypothetical protein
MIIGFLGDMRSGKTLSAVKELYKLYRHGYNIYSNIHLNFPHKIITLEMLENIVEEGKGFGDDDAVVFIDEWHVNFGDSRTSMTKKNRIISYFLLQSGKIGKSSDYGMILCYTTQYAENIDRRLRKCTAITCFCEKFDIGKRKIFHSEYHTIKNGEEIINEEWYFGEKYFSLYDTREIVSLEHSKYDEDE